MSDNQRPAELFAYKNMMHLRRVNPPLSIRQYVIGHVLNMKNNFLYTSIFILLIFRKEKHFLSLLNHVHILKKNVLLFLNGTFFLISTLLFHATC